jgi:ABC-type transport system involved in multi-copper enzyme maturation permease subunit
MLGELRTRVWLGIVYFVVLEVLLIGAMVYWPQFAENLDKLRSLIPLPVLQAMADEIEASGFPAYLAAQHFFKGANSIGGLVSVLLAMFAVALEVQRGTLEIWLARPVSRARLFCERWLCGAFWLVLPVFASTLSVPWIAGYVDERVDVWPLILLASYQSLFLLTIYAPTFLLSCWWANPLGIGFAMLLLALFQMSIYLIEKLTHYSYFRLADVPTFVEIYDTESLPVGPTLVLCVLVIVPTLLAWKRFERLTP